MLIVALWASPVLAQRLMWEQDSPVNPQTDLYRLYTDVGPLIVRDVVCSGVAPVFTCSAPLPSGWTRGYLTAENAVGESLPSNTIDAPIPITAVPSAPRNFRWTN